MKDWNDGNEYQVVCLIYKCTQKDIFLKSDGQCMCNESRMYKTAKEGYASKEWESILGSEFVYMSYIWMSLTK